MLSHKPQVKGAGVPCYDEEIFGPALCVIQVASLAEAIDLVNTNPMGNGVALFTKSGGAARKFQHEIEVGALFKSIARNLACRV